MKRYMVAIVALFLAVTIAVPALAVEFRWGGQFRLRYVSQNNFVDFSDDTDDHNNFFDQRMRMYMMAVASENLRVVTRWEMGDTRWGQNGSGGRVGADEKIIELKNAYVDFNIPCAPVRAKLGIQGIAFLDSWIIDDDFSAAVLEMKMNPFTFSAGYIASQTVANEDTGLFSDSRQNIDSFFASVDYKEGPFGASFVAYYQRGHQTGASFFPSTINTPTSVASYGDDVKNNNFWDLGLKLTYKVDWMNAYVTFIKNLGSVDLNPDLAADADGFNTCDYTGYAIDLGANFFYGPWTFNVGGFYISGPDTDDDGNMAIDGRGDIEFFTYPLATSKYFSEIMGGGILDNRAPSGISGDTGTNSNFWKGYGAPTNMWTITAGAAYQLFSKTKLSASYWYFNTASAVSDGESGTTHDLGHEIDFYVTQGVVEGLTLDLVAAYMFTGEAFGVENRDNIYELGARLQWQF